MYRTSPLLLSILGLALLCPPAIADTPSAALSTKVIAWANANISVYNKAMNYANHGPKPAVPVPPDIDPPCNECDCGCDLNSTQGAAQVNGWIQQSEKPEIDYITSLLAIERNLELLGGSNSDILTPAAQKAISQFSESAADDATKSLANRLVNGKAIPMGQEYDSDPKKAYAGIMLMLKVTREATLIIGGSDSSNEDQVLDLAKTWTQSIANKINDDIFSGYKYNLCPIYSSIFRQVELLGGPETDMESYIDTIQKLDKFLHFDVSLNLHAVGTAKDSGGFDLTWSGKAKLYMTIDQSQSCYQPQFQNGGTMAVNVDSWTMTGGDGTPVELTSAHSYNITLGSPKLDLCDPSPLLEIPFVGTSFPVETLEAKGHTVHGGTFGGFLGGVVAANDVDTAQTNALTGNKPAPAAPAPSSSQQNQAQQQMDATKQSIMSHQNDPNWLMGPQGQAAIAKLQQEAVDMAKAKIVPIAPGAANAKTGQDIANAFSEARLNWSNGSNEPVNQTLHLDKDNLHVTLTMTVQQEPQ